MRGFKFLVIAFLAVCPAVAAGTETKWSVHPSEGLDAALLVGILSGDKLQAEEYPDEIAEYRPALTTQDREALSRIGAFFAERGRGLAGPSFAYYLAAAKDQTLDGMIAALNDPVRFKKDVTGEAVGDSVDGRDAFVDNAADFRTGLRALKRLGFSKTWKRKLRPSLASRSQEIEAALSLHDIIPLHEKYLGRDLDSEIDVIVLHYNRPYGIRVHGQRFITNEKWPDDITLRTAAHEIFHPPFELENADIWEAADALAHSPLIESILKNADPAFGYSDFEGILNEDSTQALDKLVSEKIGIEVNTGDYWREQDGGMHLLAAAIYDAMKEEGFAEMGGRYEDWILKALTDGTLSPDAVRERASKIVGEVAVGKWMRPTADQ